MLFSWPLVSQHEQKWIAFFCTGSNIKTGRQIVTVHDFHNVMNDSWTDLALVAGDRIVVQERPDVREDYKVIVDGEVEYPGTYPLSKDSTQLSTVIEWCGGFTEYASLASAQVLSRYGFT